MINKHCACPDDAMFVTYGPGENDGLCVYRCGECMREQLNSLADALMQLSEAGRLECEHGRDAAACWRRAPGERPLWCAGCRAVDAVLTHQGRALGDWENRESDPPSTGEAEGEAGS